MCGNVRAVRVTAVFMLLAALAFGVALVVLGVDVSGSTSTVALAGFGVTGAIGVIAAAAFALAAQAAARRGQMQRGSFALALAYCLLLALPASAIYRVVDGWQDLPAIGRAVGSDSAGYALILAAPDETTRAFVDMFARTDVELIRPPMDEQAIARLRELTAGRPHAFVLAQWPGRQTTPALQRLAHALGVRLDSGPAERADPAWAAAAGLAVVHLYALPNGRRYALLQRAE